MELVEVREKEIIGLAEEFLKELDEEKWQLVPEVAKAVHRIEAFNPTLPLGNKIRNEISLAEDLADAIYSFQIDSDYDKAKRLLFWVSKGKTHGAIIKGKGSSEKVKELESRVHALEADLENASNQASTSKNELLKLQGRYEELKEHELNWFTVCPRCRYTPILDEAKKHEGSVESVDESEKKNGE